MTWFLDTNTCIFFLKGVSPRIARNMDRHGPRDIKIPSMVAAELILGAAKSAKARSSAEVIEKFLAPMEIVPFDRGAAECYARIRADLERKGKTIGPNDLVIAATAFAHNATLVTNNVREFKRVTGLAVTDWT